MANCVVIHQVLRVKYMMLIIFLMCGLVHMNGQEVWTIDQFLEYKDVEDVLPFTQNLNFLYKDAKGMPLVDNYEFRTETDEMELDRQQFQFRFEFNSNDERKAYDRILAVSKAKYLLLQEKHKIELLESRYNNIIDIHFLQKEIELMNDEFELLDDKRKVLKKIMQNNSEIDVEDWITNENEIFELRSDSLEYEVQKREIAQTIFTEKKELPKLESSDIIAIEKLKGEFAKLKGENLMHPDQALVKMREEMADAEYQLEVAEANKWFNFAQIEYQADDNVSFQRELSFSTSIVIPHKNNNRVKKNDATLELLERSYESKLELEENKKEKYLEEAKFYDLLDQLEEFKELRASQRLKETYNEYAEQKLVSPLILIGIKRAILNNDRKQLDLEKDIYEVYINLLVLNASLLNNNKKNYLTE